jgi:hypothetical protein
VTTHSSLVKSNRDARRTDLCKDRYQYIRLSDGGILALSVPSSMFGRGLCKLRRGKSGSRDSSVGRSEKLRRILGYQYWLVAWDLQMLAK